MYLTVLSTPIWGMAAAAFVTIVEAAVRQKRHKDTIAHDVIIE